MVQTKYDHAFGSYLAQQLNVSTAAAALEKREAAEKAAERIRKSLLEAENEQRSFISQKASIKKAMSKKTSDMKGKPEGRK